MQEVETPAPPTADRIRVRVHAAGLNRADILQRKGHYPAPPGYPQNIPGLEFAGEVEAIGNEVHRWKIGDRVMGITAGGAQAEFVVVPESNLAEIPPNLSWPEAAAIPEVFITAHDALFTRANLQIGESVLIHAAGSGVGTAAVQLAHSAGATVYGTSRTADKLERVRELGLNESVAVGDTPEKFVEAVQEMDKRPRRRCHSRFGWWKIFSLQPASACFARASYLRRHDRRREIRNRSRSPYAQTRCDHRHGPASAIHRRKSRSDSSFRRRRPAAGFTRPRPSGNRIRLSSRRSSRGAQTPRIQPHPRQNRADVFLALTPRLRKMN